LFSDQDMDTPSSEENSPKSSFSIKTHNLDSKGVEAFLPLTKRPPPPIPTKTPPPLPSRATIDRKLQKSNVTNGDLKGKGIITTTGDEGFYSSQEEHYSSTNYYTGQKSLELAGFHSRCIVATPNLLPSNHRSVQKPRDVKFRSNLKTKTVSNLTALEEHQVTDDGIITTVTHWREPYL